MKEFGSRPYLKGDYPEIPRHYPGVRVVYQWDQIDAVTDRLYYIPQRWTYHRDHLTTPVTKARRDLPPQDIDYAKNATLRGVVSYTESQRRAASPSPCRPPGHRRPPLPGSAVSRATSKGSTLTADTRGRRQRPRSCLPRAPTPQQGEEQPAVQLTPLLPRKPPTGLPSRPQTPASQCSDYSWDTTSHDGFPVRPQTGNSSHTQRHSASNSRPATAATTTTIRRSRSLGRPSTAVSRRTRWSDVADDAQSLNSSILDLLQTITATDGKLKPLSPRANRARSNGNRSNSSESGSSGYPNTTTKTGPQSNSNGSNYVQNAISNAKSYNANGIDRNDTADTSDKKSNAVIAETPAFSKSKPENLLKDLGKASNAEKEQEEHASSSMPGSSFFSGQADARAEICQYPIQKTASIDFGLNQPDTRLSRKRDFVMTAHCNYEEKLGSELDQSKLYKSSPTENASTRLSGTAEKALVLASGKRGNINNDQYVTIKPVQEEGGIRMRYLDLNGTSSTNEDISKPSSTNTASQNVGEKSAQGDVDQPSVETPHGLSLNTSSLMNTGEKLDMPLSLSQSSDRSSSGDSSSQAEYLVISETSTTETEERALADKTQAHGETQPECEDESNLRAQDSD